MSAYAAESFSSNEAAEPELPPAAYDGAPSKDHTTAILRYLDSKILWDNAYRCRLESIWNKADKFKQAKQWLIASYNGASPGRYASNWASLEFREDDPDAIPLPVLDEYSSVIENEASRLGRPEYKPYIRPTGENPDAKVREGAMLSEQALVQSLEDDNWDETEHQGLLHMPSYGGWILKGWWDVSWDKVTQIGARNAMKCPAEGCNFKVSDPALSPELGMQHRDKIQPTPEVDEATGERRLKFNVGQCLTCPDHEETKFGPIVGEAPVDETGAPIGPAPLTFGNRPEKVPGGPKLEPFTPVDEELQTSDYFGRSMAETVPMGEAKTRTLHPHDVFWRNLGLDEPIAEIREVTEVHVESLDWVRARYPHKAKEVKAESSESIKRHHPIVGERALYHDGGIDSGGLFKQHVLVKEHHRAPWMEEVKGPDGKCTGEYKLNRGRSIIVANGVLLLDADYMIESKTRPGVLIERVFYDYAPWELRSGGREKSGISLSESLFDAQEQLNEMESQDQDARQRMGSPKWLTERQMNLSYETIGGAGAHYLYDANPLDASARPQEIGGSAGIQGIEAKVASKIEYMSRRAGTSDVEFGNVPPGVDSGTMLQILADQTSERRRPRIRRIREMLQRVWTHRVRLMEEFVREPRQLWYQQDSGEWQQRAWDGNSFAGQTTVRIDPEPEHDTALVKRQNVRDAVTLGVLNPQDPKMAAKIRKELNLPAAMNEAEEMQTTSAEREFIDFLDMGEDPMVDPDKDDHGMHYDRHGTDCHSEKWRDLETKGKWKDALKLLYGWNTASIPGPPMPVTDPMTGQPMIDPATGQPAMQPGPALTPTQAIQQTMPPEAWPKAPELQILLVWGQIVGEIEGADPDSLFKVLRFRAHMAAHKQEQEMLQTAAAAGQQVQAAPEGIETAAGTVPAATGGAETQPVMEGM